jgi:hypothetical protein
MQKLEEAKNNFEIDKILKKHEGQLTESEIETFKKKLSYVEDRIDEEVEEEKKSDEYSGSENSQSGSDEEDD